MSAPGPSRYSTIPIPSLSVSTLSATISSVSSTLSSHTRGTTVSGTTSTTVTSQTTPAFAYTQIAGKQGQAALISVVEPLVAAADLTVLCPKGDCLEDCQNVTRVFQSIPDGIREGDVTYGKQRMDGTLADITLFGVCSNIENVSSLARKNTTNSKFDSYFPSAGSEQAYYNVTRDISMCFLDTCKKTRDPNGCIQECSLDSLRSSNTSLDFQDGMFPCLFRLCSNTCGLPYANQDVFGVGLLASYITQGILVLILAAVFIILATWRHLREKGTTKSDISQNLRESLETFLSAQCYFGISAVIASFFLHPATVDPLSGYALLSVAITGFLPTTFTLMLLHSHGVSSLYTTFLTTLSWLLSSVLFFMLFRNLVGVSKNPQAVDSGLNALFKADSCGSSSAMNLCKQTMDTNPLAYLDWFYNNQSIPNIKNVPVLWVLSTVVLVILLVIQALSMFRDRKHKSRPGRIVGLICLYAGSILLSLALGYQARMVIAYAQMDVIDWDGWTFGQVVALLFWVPALLDCMRSYMKRLKMDNNGRSHQQGYTQLGGQPNSAALPVPQAMPINQLPPQEESVTPYEPLRLPNTGDSIGSDITMSPIVRKPVPRGPEIPR